MISIIRERLQQGQRTIAYPAGDPPSLPDRFRGLPVLDESKCPDGCRACVEACPTDAISRDETGPAARHGPLPVLHRLHRSLPRKERSAIRQDYRLATRTREDLIVRSGQELTLARPLEQKMRQSLRPLAQAPAGERRRRQRLRGRLERARNGRLRHGPVRHPVRRLASPR